jgi:hypothetical protein
MSAGSGPNGRLAATVGIPTPEKVSFAAGTFEMFDFADLSNEPAYGAYFPAKVLTFVTN